MNESEKTPLESAGISERLRNCLSNQGVHYLEDLPAAMPQFEGGNIKGIGKKTLDELNRLHGRLQVAGGAGTGEVTEVLKYPESDSADTTPLGRLEQILPDWYAHGKNKDEYQLVSRRYGLAGNIESTLDDVGIFLGVSKERVRQIELRDIQRITFLVNGDIDPKTATCLPGELVGDLNWIRTIVTGKEVHDFSIFCRDYKEQFGVAVTRRDYGILKLLLHCWQYTLVQTTACFIIVSDKFIDTQLFIKVAETVIFNLKKGPEPVKEFDLVTTVRKKIKNSKLKNIHVTAFCDAHPFISILYDGNERCYEINQIHLLKSPMKAYRILRDAKNKVMHLSEINAEIRRRQLNETGDSGTAISTTNILTQSELFNPVGKTGMWTLAANNISTLTVPEVIQEYLDISNEPVSAANLVAYIRSKPGRESFDSQKLCILLNQHQDRFARTEDGQITVAQRNSSTIATIKRMSAEQVFETVKQVFEIYGADTMPRPDFMKHITNAGIVQSTVYALLHRDSYLKAQTTIDGTATVSLDRKNRQTQKNDIGTLQNQIIDALVTILQHIPDKTMPLNDLVTKVVRTTGCKRPYIYQILDKSLRFIKQNRGTDNEPVVILTGQSETIEKNAETAAPHSLEDDIRAIINEGEGVNVEYKSTLRWDLRLQALNKELEHEVMKNVCAFANTEGGNLLIGVEDKGNILGLEHDYKVLGSKEHRDGFLLKISNLLNTLFGNAICALVKVEIVAVEGRDICRIKVRESPEPVYLENSRIFVRVGSSTRELNPKETVEYIRRKFGNNRE